jgi:hypothetical protein
VDVDRDADSDGAPAPVPPHEGPGKRNRRAGSVRLAGNAGADAGRERSPKLARTGDAQPAGAAAAADGDVCPVCLRGDDRARLCGECGQMIHHFCAVGADGEQAVDGTMYCKATLMRRGCWH